MLKVGDIVTQNEYFYGEWDAPIYYRKIIKLSEGSIIHFDVDIRVRSKTTGKIYYYTSFHSSWFKVDKQRLRKEKLEKLYE